MKTHAKSLLIILLLSTVIDCGSSGYLLKKISTFNHYSAVIIEPQTMQEYQNILDVKEQFNGNIYIGSIQFSGGLIKNPKLGMMIQSKNHHFTDQEEFKTIITSQYQRALSEMLTGKDVRFTFIKVNNLKELIRIDSSIDYEKTDDDGKDNISMPRIKYNAHGEIKRENLKKFKNADFLFLPIVEYFYGHNGGWFNNQYYGCGAGARLSIHLYVYDVKTGIPVFIFQDNKKKLYEYKFSMSTFEMKQELKVLQKEIFHCLSRSLP